MPLPDDRDERNALPVWDGCVAYFPDCWAEIAKVSVVGNKQHSLGTKLGFARDISTDHANKVMRHMLDHAAGNVFDSDGTYHLAKAAWRALAALQIAIETRTGVVAPTAVNSANLPTEHSKCPWCMRSGGHHMPLCRGLEEEELNRRANGYSHQPSPQGQIHQENDGIKDWKAKLHGRDAGTAVEEP